MELNQPGRHTHDTKYGPSKDAIAEDGSWLQLEPGSEAYAFAWSTQDPAVEAVRLLLEREIAQTEPESGVLAYSGEQAYSGELMYDQSWQEIWEKFVDTDRDEVITVSFSFPSRRIALVHLHRNPVTLGIAYFINHTNGRPLPADVQALIEAFADTAAHSLRPHLDWALESVES